MTTETEQTIPSRDEQIDWMPVEDHLRILHEREAEWKVKETHYLNLIRKLEEWGNGLQVKLASVSQELYLLKNKFPDLENIFKGMARWAPDSFKNAMMLLDYLWAAHQTVWGMYKRAHEKTKRPLWHWGFLFFFGALTFGVTVEAFQSPVAISGAMPYIALIAVVSLIVFLMLRRKKQKVASTPI